MTASNPILKAIDDEHAKILKTIREGYDKRMKDERAKLSTARAALARAETALGKAEARYSEDLKAGIAEAGQRRLELRLAVIGKRKPRP